jgi:hypothetical protein
MAPHQYVGSGSGSYSKKPLTIGFEFGPQQLHLVLVNLNAMPNRGGGGDYEIGIQTRNAKGYAHKIYYSYNDLDARYADATGNGQFAYRGEAMLKKQYGIIFGVASGFHANNNTLALILGLRYNFNQ